MKYLYKKSFIYAFIVVFVLAAFAIGYLNKDSFGRFFSKNSWFQVSSQTPWGERAHFALEVFNNKIWVMGGVTEESSEKRFKLLKYLYFLTLSSDQKKAILNKLWAYGGGKLNDVWYSSDGIDWAVATKFAPWSPRRDPASAVFDGKMWILGGYIDGNNLNDVWYTTNGVDWIQAASSTQWSPRRGHATIVYDDKMWVIGGVGNGGFWDNTLNDVWYSIDGINWTEATAAASWGKRSFHTALVYDDKMWVIGGWGGWGKNFNDVWYSSDGKKWHNVTGSAQWSPRWGHASVSYDNKMWVMGGDLNSELRKDKPESNEVWYSQNGIDWHKIDSANWSPRKELKSVIFEDKMWIMGGASNGKIIPTDISIFSDIWNYPANAR